MNGPERVVFDCNVFFQALISPTGPAGQSLEAAYEGRCQLFIATFVLDELAAVAARPTLARRFSLTPERVAVFMESIVEAATVIGDVPRQFEYPRDPDDARYVDLALVAQAKLVVSRDRDLLALADPTTAAGLDFRRRFPMLQILTPTDFLAVLEQR